MTGGSDEVRLEAVAGATTPSVRIQVKVVPGAKRQKIAGPHGGALKVMIAQPPEDGAANRALCQLLAKHFGLPARQVEVIQGHASAWKTVRVTGLSIEEARARLNSIS